MVILEVRKELKTMVVDKTVILSGRVSEKLQRKMKVHCAKHAIKIQMFIEEAIKDRLTKEQEGRNHVKQP